MKKVLGICMMLTFLATTTLAQTTEAKITYSIEMESDDPNMAMALPMLEGSTMSIAFKDQMSRVEMNMGGMMNTTTITDGDSGKSLTLMSGMMGKIATETEVADLDTDSEDVDVEFSSETKSILGYKCKKAVVTDEEGNEIEFWYTEELKPAATDGKYMNGQVPGASLEFSIINPQMSMTMTATDVKKKVDNAKEMFSMKIPAGYEVKTTEELEQMGQGM